MRRLLLLHGNASCRDAWRLVAERLEAPAEAPDLPGFGGAPPTARPYVDVLADWLTDGPCVVAAAGTTGAIALQAALRHPGSVAHVVLVGPAGLPGGHARLVWLGRTRPGAALLRHAGATWARRRFLADQLGADRTDVTAGREPVPADVRDTLVEGLRRSRGFAALAAQGGVAALEGVRALGARVDVLWGERSGVQPVSGAAALMRLLPDHARLRIVPDAGHALALQVPDLVATLLDEWRRPDAPEEDRRPPA